ncbi:MAG: hypothetical protein V7L23_30835 [Nostoc sp.]|uniref:hypothetical protein n=1 Tax=Nostoc sp. TaxID=1180 RepID=UPI002FF19DCB
MWEQPTSLFLQYPGLIPFAVLGQSAASQEFDRRQVETWLEAERAKEVKARLVQEQKVARFQRLFFLGALSWALIVVLGLGMVNFEYKKHCPAFSNPLLNQL